MKVRSEGKAEDSTVCTMAQGGVKNERGRAKQDGDVVTGGNSCDLWVLPAPLMILVSILRPLDGLN